MTLIKLRLDLQFTNLANRFLCHEPLLQAFLKIRFMYCIAFKKFSYWPEREIYNLICLIVSKQYLVRKLQ
ncbi:hypothetical protein NQ314_018255 [Rhamnusium bicolor]|uniref:Uncharacterized protein n=1 Tax=Rhamnusium bicolor TaxID=1586634 RepID=A0AAV8WRR7_9CUCU|nr:hypothetical protein NQ314_018255 [Rhamnusium bicolor]